MSVKINSVQNILIIQSYFQFEFRIQFREKFAGRYIGNNII